MAAKTIKNEVATKTVANEVKKAAKPTTKTAPKKEQPKKEVKAEKPNKEKKAKAPVVNQMKNSELEALFRKCGCSTHTKAKDESNVVYNTFGTKSRVLQQNRAYQLLLTNGHKLVKNELVDCDNDDTARFVKFYKSLSKDEQSMVNGYDNLMVTVLSKSELPRERTVKITNYDLLVKFLTFMSTFEENKVVQA